jgi:hypothetical protein
MSINTDSENLTWFSALIQLLSVVDRTIISIEKSLIIFQCPGDFEKAFQIALEIGQEKEHQYIGMMGDSISIVFDKVITLDFVGETIQQGHEVLSLRESCEIIYRGNSRPEDSNPYGTTGNI